MLLNFSCPFFTTCFFYSPPGNIMDVSNFRCTNQRETEVDLVWEYPELRLPFTNVTYDLTWIPNSGKSNYTTGNHTTISNLTSGQVYKFKLYFTFFDGKRRKTYTHQPSVTVRTSKFTAFLYLFIFQRLKQIYRISTFWTYDFYEPMSIKMSDYPFSFGISYKYADR